MKAQLQKIYLYILLFDKVKQNNSAHVKWKRRRTEILLFDIKGEKKETGMADATFLHLTLKSCLYWLTHTRKQMDLGWYDHSYDDASWSFLSLSFNWSSIKKHLFDYWANTKRKKTKQTKQLFARFLLFLPESRRKLNIGRKNSSFFFSAILRRWARIWNLGRQTTVGVEYVSADKSRAFLWSK